jgi:hypothetical protein
LLICRALHSLWRRLKTLDFSAAAQERILFPPSILPQKMRSIFPFQSGWFHAPFRSAGQKKGIGVILRGLFTAQLLLLKSEGACAYDGGEIPEIYKNAKIRQGISLLPQGCVLPYFCNK